MVGVLILALPIALAWWNARGPGIVAAAMPIPTPAMPTSSPSGPSGPTATPAANCRSLRGVYPRGVKRPGADNAGAKVQRGISVDRIAYQANKALDRDLDGIACEVPRKRS